MTDKRAPIFVEELEDTPVVESSHARLEVQYEGHPEPEVTWFFTDEDAEPEQRTQIREGGRYELEFSEDGGTYSCALIVKDAVVEDIGFYTCRIENEVECAECTAELGVEEIPS
ncbi:myosin light chain kinase, smooth muscle-like [Glandiceps talaboti]